PSWESEAQGGWPNPALAPPIHPEASQIGNHGAHQVICNRRRRIQTTRLNNDLSILKRETAGRYRSADGRFTVESQGANDWYMADEEQVDQLGQPVLRGPYPSLAAAREAVAEARAKPVVGRALPRVKTTPGDARPP